MREPYRYLGYGFWHAMRGPPHDHHHDLQAARADWRLDTRLLKLADFARRHGQSA
jgi:hypothetical protein